LFDFFSSVPLPSPTLFISFLTFNDDFQFLSYLTCTNGCGAHSYRLSPCPLIFLRGIAVVALLWRCSLFLSGCLRTCLRLLISLCPTWDCVGSSTFCSGRFNSAMTRTSFFSFQREACFFFPFVNSFPFSHRRVFEIVLFSYLFGSPNSLVPFKNTSTPPIMSCLYLSLLFFSFLFLIGLSYGIYFWSHSVCF